MASLGALDCTSTNKDGPADMAPSGDLASEPDLLTPDLTLSAWFTETSPRPDTLRAIAGSSASDVYAVGSGGTILHARGDGNWLVQASSVMVTLNAVFAVPGEAFAVGEMGTILHLRNGKWMAEPSGTTTGLNGVWGSSASDVYAVGNRFFPQGEPYIFHSTGDGTWTPQLSAPLANQMTQLLAISGTSAKDIYIVGTKGAILHGVGDGKWPLQASPKPLDLRSVWAARPTDIYAVGAGGAILHSTGDGSWVVQATVAEAGDLAAVWSDGTQPFAVGTMCAILRGTGGMWGPSERPGGSLCTGVWGAAKDDVYVIGSLGLILHRRK
ncbi:MAG: hypothetical protein EXR72_26740 [Myxococcales bacterium]|nr:hypothetical protein [Myxococcales bacterium]